MDDGDDAPPTNVTADERGPRGARRPDAQHGGRYELDRKLGEGGMGEVLSARDDQIGREVAIKRMKQRDPSDRAIARFLREARIQGRLEHPSIVPVHEIGRDATGLPFFSMKKLSGVTLEQVIEDTPEAEYPRQRLLRAFVDVCLAVELAHTRGVVHRDLKPANIMLGDFGEVYVLDWGVAKVTGEAEIETTGAISGELATVAGSVIGTVGYMAPEQAAGREVDHRADIYALGCVLFEILTREQLNAGIEPSLDSPSQRAPDIVPELDHACRRATEVDPERRWQTARELGAAIQMFLDGDRDIAARRALAADHLAKARELAAGELGESRYREAIRAAGQALALDPTSRDAAALMARLMLEPPLSTPAEVEGALRDDDDAQFRTFGRISIVSATAYVPFIPMWLAVVPAFNVAVLVALLVLNVGVAWANSRGKDLPAVVVLVARVGIIAALAWTFSPLFLAPALGASFAMALALDPRNTNVKRAIAIVVALSLAVLGPAIAEAVGWLPSTATVTSEGVLFHAPGLENMSLWYVAAYHVALTSASVFIAYALAMSLRMARRQLQLQAWQLKQLVPVTD